MAGPGFLKTGVVPLAETPPDSCRFQEGGARFDDTEGARVEVDVDRSDALDARVSVKGGTPARADRF